MYCCSMPPRTCVSIQAFSANSLPRVHLLQATPWRQTYLQLQCRRGRPRCKMSTPVSSNAADAAVTGEELFSGNGPVEEIINITDEAGMIDAIREALMSMGEGEISCSAYDTAWVALVKKMDGGDGPQFPSSLDWIVQNQLPDGSWGDGNFFLVYDRIISTLACIVTLKHWNVHADKCEKGVSFIRENMWRLAEDDEVDWMIVGFEITFPSLLQVAKDLGLDIPYDDTVLQAIYDRRDLKLAKIPIDVLHTIPTTLLLSIEGMPGLDWTKLLNLQSGDGSFMSSPAVTAFALMETGDRKCFEYINRIVHKFNGGVPINYPVDIFEHLWAVDRLDRLGISRYFATEIKECLDYVYRQWSPEGLAVTDNFPVNDIDDTAMGFRILRLHGYHVSPSVFEHFEKEGEFCCYPGQLNKSITAMYNMYRAAQVVFPMEDVLLRANSYCRAFLAGRQSSNKLIDKWAIPKDLPGEVGYALSFPWRASLPRIETRMYLEQYGGSGDVWIGKVLYRMPLFCNEMYLSLAQADFRNFQRQCRLEWTALERWHRENSFQKYGVRQKNALRAYFLAAANIFEPNRAEERLAWARTAMLAEAISWLLRCNDDYTDIIREDLTTKLTITRNNDTNNQTGGLTVENSTDHNLVRALSELIDLQPLKATTRENLREAWRQWLMARSGPSGGDTALLLARTVEICSGRYQVSAEQQKHKPAEFFRLEWLTSSICDRLSTTGSLARQDGGNMETVEINIDQEEELYMQELSRLVLEGYNGIDRVTCQTYLSVVKSFYYVAYSSPETIHGHISKVLFEDVL